MISQIVRPVPVHRPDAALLTAVTLMLAGLVPAAAVLEVPVPILAVLAAFLGMVIFALRPDLATLIVIAIVYSNAAAVAVRVHDVPFVLAAGSSLLLTIPVGYYLLVRREPVVIPSAVPWIVAYLLVQLVSALFARDSSIAAAAIGTFLSEGLILYLLIVNTVRTERMVIASIWVLLSVGALLGLLSLHQAFLQNYDSSYFGFAQLGGDPTDISQTRTAGPFDGANRYAQILILLLPLVFAMVWARFSVRSTILSLTAGAIIAVAMALTLSRGAAVGFAMVLLLMFVLRYIRFSFLLPLIGVIVLLFFALPQFGNRLESLQEVPGVAPEGVEADGSIRSRLTEMSAAALVFTDHPLIGVGPDQFPLYYQSYAQDFGLRIKTTEREAHSLYVDIPADYGLFGTIAFFGAIAVTIRELARTRSRLIAIRPQLAHLAAGFMLSIVAFLTSGIFLHLAYERYLWLMMALGAAVAVIGARYADENSSDAAGSTAT